jgi:hypothetical protein
VGGDVNAASSGEKNSAHRALGRLLRLALPDSERRTAVLDEALHSAERDELPSASAELLDFVRAHLVPSLTKEIGQSLAQAILEDLSTEIRSANGLEPDARVEFASTTAPPVAPASHAFGRISLPKLRDSLTNLVRAAGVRVREVIGSADGSRTKPPQGGVRRTVFVVSTDRVSRAAIARALLGARFDVEALDSASDLVSSLREQKGMAIAILDLTDAEITAALPVFVAVAHELRVVATSNQNDAHAAGLLASAGARLFVVHPSRATPPELVESARKLAAS